MTTEDKEKEYGTFTDESDAEKSLPGDSSVTWCAWLILHLDIVAQTIILPFLPSYGFSAVVAGLILMFKPLAELLGNMSFLPTRLADKYGPRWPAVGGMLFITLGSIMFAFLVNLPCLLIARFLMGVGGAFAVPAGMKIIALQFEGRQVKRERAISFAMSGDALGGVVGPVLGSALFQLGMVFRLSVYWCRVFPLSFLAFFSLGAALLAFFAAVEILSPDDSSLFNGLSGITTVARVHFTGPTGIAALCFGLTAFHIGALEVMNSFYALKFLHIGPNLSGYFWALVGLGYGVVALTGPYLMQFSASVDKMDSEAVIAKKAWIWIPVGSLFLIVYPLLNVWTRTLLAYSVAVLFLGFAMGWIFVPSNAFTQRYALKHPDLGQSVMAQLMGLWQASKNFFLILGYALGPVVTTVSWDALWITLSSVGAASLLAGLSLRFWSDTPEMAMEP